MKTIHNNIKREEEPEAKPTLIARIRNWYRRKLGGTGIPIKVEGEEELPEYKYNVDINTGAGVVKLSQTAVSVEQCRQRVITWFINNKLIVKPELLDLVKGSNELFRYKCNIQTGSGNFVRIVQAATGEAAVHECKLWFVQYKLKTKITLVGPVIKKQDAESGKKQ